MGFIPCAMAIFVMLALLAAGCFGQTSGVTAASVSTDSQQEVPAKVYDDPDAYAVYDALLPSEWSWKAADSGRLVIQLETVAPSSAGIEPTGKSKALLDPLIAAFNELCKTRYRLKAGFHLQKSYDLVPETEIFRWSKGPEGWPEFYRAHPNSGGFLTLSPVAFNANKTIAIVYIGHSCGSLCGGGAVHVLQRQGTNWVPLKYEGNTTVWAS